MSVNLKLIIHEILEGYVLPIHGDHGVGHWARVLENGLRLSELTKSKYRRRFAIRSLS